VNPKGYVPALEIKAGEILTEGPGDRAVPGRPEAAVRRWCRRRDAGALSLQEMLGYINSEIHKTYSPLFNKATSARRRTSAREYLKKRYAYVEGFLATRPYLVGDKFSAADAYLFTVTNWAKFVNLDLSGYRTCRNSRSASPRARPSSRR
jgi:glutathione S-transferase